MMIAKTGIENAPPNNGKGLCNRNNCNKNKSLGNRKENWL